MFKNFQAWHIKKSLINGAKRELFFYEKEIWWTSVGHNIRFEQDGKGKDFSRPVLILRKFNAYMFFGVPLSTTKKEGKYYYSFSYISGVNSVALLSQLKAMDANRLVKKDGQVTDKIYQEIQNKILKIISENPQK